MMLIAVPNFCIILRNITDENIFYSKVSKLYQSLKIFFFPKRSPRFCSFSPSSLNGAFSLNEIKSHITRRRFRVCQYLLFHCPLK